MIALLEGLPPVLAVLFAVWLSKRQLDANLEQWRRDMAKLELHVRRLLKDPGAEVDALALIPGVTEEDPPVLELPSPLPRAVVLRTKTRDVVLHLRKDIHGE